MKFLGLVLIGLLFALYMAGTLALCLYATRTDPRPILKLPGVWACMAFWAAGFVAAAVKFTS